MSAVATEEYALTPKTHAHRLARLMNGRWVSSLRAAVELHITEIHPRLPEIERAGGAFIKREWGSGADKWAEYTLTKVPRVKGLPPGYVDTIKISVPGMNDAADFVPPPRVDL